jgi:hypothetical protein
MKEYRNQKNLLLLWHAINRIGAKIFRPSWVQLTTNKENTNLNTGYKKQDNMLLLIQ